MFCTKCGCRIPMKAQKCPDCGADLPVMEYCGGFWSELNQNMGAGTDFEERDDRQTEADLWEKPAGTAAVDTGETIPGTGGPGDSTPPEDKEKGPGRKRAGRKRPAAAYAAAVLFLLLAASVCFIILQKRQLTAQEETLQELQNEQETLRQENSRLLGEYAALRVQYAVWTIEKEIRNVVYEVRGGMFEAEGENDPDAEDSGTAETGGSDTEEPSADQEKAEDSLTNMESEETGRAGESNPNDPANMAADSQHDR